MGQRPEPEVPAGWVRVHVRAAALNHHDLWSLRGVGLKVERLPMTLGCDAAGITDDGREVVVHAVIADPDAGDGDETLDTSRSLLSEVYQGTLAEQVVVPRRNLVDKPTSMSFEQAACLPTAWLTAYRMLFVRGECKPGETVLVQGAGGGVATAAIALGTAAGLRMWVTSRDGAKRDRARELGASAVFESGARLPAKVDAVIETVGEATWAHSLRSLRPGGRVVVAGATSGPNPPADLNRVFFLSQQVLGSTMGSRGDLVRLLSMLDVTGVRPVVDACYPLAETATAVARMAAGDVFGKLVLIP